MRILIVEDEKDLNRVIEKRLKKEGYRVDCCFNGEEAEEFMNFASYDCIVLDIMMPKMDGITFLSRLRGKGDLTPVLLLSAKDTVADRVTGLDSGADDYLTKPFDFDELLARIRVMGRKYTSSKNNIYTMGDLSVDTLTKNVTRAGKNIELSAKEYALMEYLIKNKGITLSREQIENNIWNYDYEGGSNVVDVYMSYLRKKIDGGYDEKYIHTVWGKGWCLKEGK